MTILEEHARRSPDRAKEQKAVVHRCSVDSLSVTILEEHARRVRQIEQKSPGLRWHG